MDKRRHLHSMWVGALLVGLMLFVAACSDTATPPPPTRTPAPTFTPTVPGVAAAVDPNALATVQAAQQAQAALPVEGQQPAPSTDGAQPLVESTSVFSDIAPTDPNQAVQPVVATVAPTPAPAANPELSITEIANVRGGPGLTYNILGQANPGQTFPVTGKSPDGLWWQVTFNGQPGWLFGELVTATNTETVAVAQNIPVAPPPPTAAPVVVPPTAVPAPVAEAPTAVPATPAPAASNYKFNITAVSRCERQPAGNWFEGKTYVGGTPQSGFKVVFSYAADAPPITAPVISGPHEGYPGWDQGFYSHIISSSGPIAGTWYVWVVDDAGQRISEIASWTSTGPGEGCNQAVVDFDSR